MFIKFEYLIAMKGCDRMSGKKYLDLQGLSSFLTHIRNTFSHKDHVHDERYYTESEIDSKLDGKSNTNHTHTISNATQSSSGLMSASDKAKLDNIENGAQVNQNAFSNVYVNGTTLSADIKTDTLTLVGSNVTLTPDATNDKVTVGITKANVTSALGYTPPTTNTTYSDVTISASGLMPAADKIKLNGIATGAEVNQNAFSNIVVGSTTIAADSKTDTLTLTAGNNVTLTPNSTSDSITISSTNTVYTHPTSSGNKHIPAGGASGQILRWSADGTAIWGADNNTTYSAGTGISLSGTTFSNAGVRSVATGSSNGTISVNTGGTTANIPVKGLGSAAYTESSAYSPSSHTHSYLPLGGGVLTGRLTANGKISAPTSGSSWISGMTPTNATIGLTTQNTSGSYHPIIAGKTYSGHFWNLGTITDTVGFYGFKSGRTENATDWSATINVSNGAASFSNSVTSPTFIGALSGNALTATTATTANKLGSSTIGSSTKPIYLNAGTPTASGSTVGSSTKPIYLNAGTITASGSTIGAVNKPMYLNAGTMTACSSTVGSSSVPVYMNAGAVTQCSGTLGVSITGTSYKSNTMVPITTGGTGAAYTATVSGITSLTVGVNFIMLPHVNSTTTDPTLNVNGLGAKPIAQRVTNSTSQSTNLLSSAFLVVNKPVRVVYDGINWVIDVPRVSPDSIYGQIPATKTNVVVGSTIKNLQDAWNSLSPISFKDSVQFSEGYVNVHFVVHSGMVFISYQGEGKTHAAGTLLFTIPAAYRPKSQVLCPFVKNASAYGIIAITTDGKCSVNQISSTTASGRIYFQMNYPI